MATWSILHSLVKPLLLRPAVRVPSIRSLDFKALKQAGFKGAVFDKDNCLTIPHKDTLVPQLQDAWKECIDTFGRSNVVIVSNCSGTRSDAGGLEAESVSHNLGVAVLPHTTKKPGCSSTIIDYFAGQRPLSKAVTPHATEARALIAPIQPSELIVVGDRVFTDVILGNKLGALPVWTTGLWQRELMLMRYIEYGLVGVLDTWTKWSDNRKRKLGKPVPLTPQDLFVLPPPPVKPSPPTLLARTGGVARVVLLAAFRGTRTLGGWAITRWRTRNDVPALALAGGGAALSLSAAVPQAWKPRLASALRNSFKRVGQGSLAIVASQTARLVGEDRFVRMQDTFARTRESLSMVQARTKRACKIMSVFFKSESSTML